MNLVEQVFLTIKKFEMIRPSDAVVVGISGGPDSVCLFHVLHRLKDRLKITLIPVYVDHGLRPEETPLEINFLKNFVREMGYDLIVKVVDVKGYITSTKENKQEAARKLRYQALEEVLQEKRAQAIAVGHNADDSAETILMRLIRGTGPLGLQGIPPVRGNIIRPLIEIERSQIEEYLFTEGLHYMVDSSNIKTDYLRNWLRLKVMPVLREKNPSLTKTLLRLGLIFFEEERFFEIEVTKALMRSISRMTPTTIELFLKPLEAMDKRLLRRLLRRALDETAGLRGISFIHIEDIINLLRTGKPGDRVYIKNNIRVVKEYSILRITSEPPLRLKEYVLPVPGSVRIEEKNITITAEIMDKMPDELIDGKYKIVVDRGKISSSTLIIRAWKDGDYFYPYGFGKRKKLQDFFVDSKVPRDERHSIPIIEDSGNIVWIGGYRMDERYRINENTKRFLILRIKND